MIGPIILAIVFVILIGGVYWIAINQLAEEKCRDCPYLFMYMPNEYMMAPIHRGSCDKDKDIKIVIIDRNAFAPYPNKEFVKYLQDMRNKGWENVKGRPLCDGKYQLVFKRINKQPLNK